MDLVHYTTHANYFHKITLFVGGLTKTNNTPVLYLSGYDPQKDIYELIALEFPIEPVSPLTDIVKKLGKYKSYLDVKNAIAARSSSQNPPKKKLYPTAILGFVRFLQGYYLVYVSDAILTANIASKQLLRTNNTNLQSITQCQYADFFSKEEENRHLKLFKENEVVDYYFSLTYDLTRSLAENLIDYDKPEAIASKLTRPTQFMWNTHIKQEADSLMPRWVVPVINGYVNMLHKINPDSQLIFDLLLIGRRSIFHAGTRYLKRGIDENGHPANFVEVQQILIDTSRQQMGCSSFIQIRGSVPVFWYQEAGLLKVQPPIKICDVDKEFVATKKHFSDLISTYGSQIICVNLVRTEESKPREGLLTEVFQQALKLAKIPCLYFHLDLKKYLGSPTLFHKFTTKIAYYSIMRTGFFMAEESNSKQYLEYQNGVLRTNCVDCLDRTNSFQRCVAKVALLMQIGLLTGRGLLEYDVLSLDLQQRYMKDFEEIFQQMGDIISLQYGSSIAHKQTPYQKSSVMTSITRHLNNNFSDITRQHQMDIFHGNFPTNQPYIYNKKYQIEFKPSPLLTNSSLTAQDFNIGRWILMSQNLSQPEWAASVYNEFKDRILRQLQPSIPSNSVFPKDRLKDFNKNYLPVIQQFLKILFCPEPFRLTQVVVLKKEFDTEVVSRIQNYLKLCLKHGALEVRLKEDIKQYLRSKEHVSEQELKIIEQFMEHTKNRVTIDTD